MASPPLFLRSSVASASSSSSNSSIKRVPPTTSREGTAEATVNDHISQALQSTSNLLQLMQQSSPSQAHLLKLPKNLLAKKSLTATIKNTAQVLEQTPRVISSLDAHMESGLIHDPRIWVKLNQRKSFCLMMPSGHTES
ncbi:hypothetical protein MKW94_005970 [Papaver nudicaule]|uniref:Tobamovirus multiplication protein 2B n=1 Tax=Papaver nudicaule TaxID=74823 RepID=A0AA41S230_PAPNU|nr:hypothetical protein [Papaver nudicaule]MCL7026063.1 hypothetical protein [Papaver nudicaule]